MNEIMDLELRSGRLPKLIRELEDFLGKKIDCFDSTYNQLLKHAEEDEASLYTESDGTRIQNYYGKTKKYLYELLRWEATFDKEDNFKRIAIFLKKFRLSTVLDFGGGIGGLSIYLAQNGFKCIHADIPSEHFDFANYRFTKRGNNIKILNLQQEKLPYGFFDAIVAYDVFEHIPSLDKVIEKLSNSLKNGGYLITKSTFSGRGSHLKENEQYSDMTRFDQMLGSFNLRHIGRIKDTFITDLFAFFKVHAIFGIRIKKDKKYGGDFIFYNKNG